ncbi:MAG: peptidyl-prolyl cis-trans isomerase [Candidatus Omnitrophica bacterium]|nr:peptidyl-prolyl cis-trans isomerase [Candidatus Omnitrophota bacterium]
MKNFPLFLWVIFFVVSVPFVFAQDSTVAIVNNEIITKKDLDDFINFMRIQLSSQYSEEELEARIEQIGEDLLDRLIEDRLILQAAYAQNLSVEQSRIDAKLAQIKKKYVSDLEFEMILAAQGLTSSDLKEKIKEQILMYEIINKKIKEKIVIKPQEVTDFYLATPQNFTTPEQRNVKFLTTKEKDLGESLVESIDFDNFEQIAKEHSLSITNLGWVERGQLRPEIAKSVFKLRDGQVSSLLKLDNAYYIFKVTEAMPSKEMALERVEQKIQNYLFQQKMEEHLIKWLDELKENAYIVKKMP